MTRRYRVYPNGGRARAFDSFATAVTFAERAYQGQAAGDGLRRQRQDLPGALPLRPVRVEGGLPQGRDGPTMSHDPDLDLALARAAAQTGTELRSGRKIDPRRREEEDTTYLRAVAFALIYLVEAFRPGNDSGP